MFRAVGKTLANIKLSSLEIRACVWITQCVYKIQNPFSQLRPWAFMNATACTQSHMVSPCRDTQDIRLTVISPIFTYLLVFFFFRRWTSLMTQSHGLLNNIFPFPSILDARYPIFNPHLANVLFDAVLPSVLGVFLVIFWLEDSISYLLVRLLNLWKTKSYFT